MDNRRFWLALTLVPHLGPVRIARLVEAAGSAEKAWSADASVMARAGLDARTSEALLTAQSRISPDVELERNERHGIQVITWEEAAYPTRLREIDYPPPVLYVRGGLTPEDDWGVAIVGTRQPSVYGREVAGRLATGIAERGLTVVSGLAKGIDGVAHRAALDTGGRTLAVQGCGLDRVYPPEHLRLAQSIMERGALISDFPIGTKPEPPNFPWRNRIISGLSRGVVVVEAGEHSGALVTARCALDQNREVFAVPGSINSPMSRGTNRLIQRGEAKLVASVEDILDELGLAAEGRQLSLELPAVDDPVEQRLLDELGNGEMHVDDLCRRVGLPVSTVSSSLTILELKGFVRALGGMQYALARSRQAQTIRSGYGR